MKAIETAKRKTPTYKLALLVRNWLNSLTIAAECLTKMVRIETRARKVTTTVNVIPLQ